jgi:hypothetical protein
MVVVALVGAGIGFATPAAAQVDACAGGRAPSFVFGFADLKVHTGDAMGDAVTCEFPAPNGSGDVHQRTTTGLAFWRKSTNTPTFTNGFEHWGQTPSGWITWTGSNIDPPALTVDSPAQSSFPICTGAAIDGTVMLCQLADGYFVTFRRAPLVANEGVRSMPAAIPPIITSIIPAVGPPAAGTGFAGTAEDAAGNASQPATLGRLADTARPTVQITAKPSAFTNNRLPQFQWIGTDNLTPVAGLTFQTKLDGPGTTNGSWSVFSSPTSLTLGGASGLADGTYTFSVQAQGQPGNVSLAANHGFVVDTHTPTVTIISQPKRLVPPSALNNFSFTASDALALPDSLQIQCRLDGPGSAIGSLSTCTSPTSRSYGTLAAGHYTFTLQATGLTGNTSSASYRWAVDAAPTLNTSMVPASAWGDPVSVTASAADPDTFDPYNDMLTYSLSGAPSGAAINPHTGAFSWVPTASQVSGNAYSFQVVVTDSVGLADQKTVSITVTPRATTLVYGGETQDQYSDPVALRATLTDRETRQPLTAGQTVSFSVGSQTTTSTTGSTGQATVSLILTQPAGATTVSARFGGTSVYGDASVSNTFMIVPQKTVVRLAPSNPQTVKVTKAGGTAPSMTFAARVIKKTDPGGTYGDISKAQSVTFALNPVGGGRAYSCVVGGTGGSTDTSGIITQWQSATATSPGFVATSCTFPATLHIPVNVYELKVSVGGNYYQDVADSVLSVFPR